MTSTQYDLFDVSNVKVEQKSTDPQPLAYKSIPAPKSLPQQRFVPYAPSIMAANARPHPSPLLEDRSLALIRPPKTTVRPYLPPHLIADGSFSNEQLEAIVLAEASFRNKYAISKNRTVRQGFRLDDGPGVGKTREIVGLVLSRLYDPRRKTKCAAIVITNNQLLIDGLRDELAVLGLDPKTDVQELRKTKLDADLEIEAPVLVASYAVWRQRKGEMVPVIDKDGNEVKIERGPHKGKVKTEFKITHTRVMQVQKALGADWEGLIAFDESDAGENADPMTADSLGYDEVRELQKRAKSGDEAAQTILEDANENKKEAKWHRKSASQQGATMIDLQEAFDNARVLYVSATSIPKPQALFYCERLRMWGEDGWFSSKRELFSALAENLTSMEALTRDLKINGMMISRVVSFEATTYERIEYKLDFIQRAAYDKAAGLFRGAIQRMRWELERQKVDVVGKQDMPDDKGGVVKDVSIENPVLRKIASRIGAERYHFFKRLRLEMKTKALLNLIDEYLRRGCSIVVQAAHTYEADLKAELARLSKENPDDEVDLEQVCTSAIGNFIKVIEDSYPIYFYYIKREGQHATIEKRLDMQGNPRINKRALERRDLLIAELRDLADLNVDPITALRSHYRDGMVEVTGVSQYLDIDENGDREVKRRGAITANRKALKAFNGGESDVIFISEGAGCVGISLHSDRRFLNTKKRVHIVFEIPQTSKKAIQALGRTNRTGQVVPPHYVLLHTDIPSERREFSALAKSMAEVGALTRGDRKANDTELLGVEDSLQHIYAAQAVTLLFRRMIAGNLKLTAQEFQEMTGVNPGDWPGISNEKTATSKDVLKFLNCTVMLPLETGAQDYIYEQLDAHIAETIQDAMDAGTFDSGMNAIEGDSIKLARSIPLTKRSQIATLEVVNGKNFKLGFKRACDERSRANEPFKVDNKGNVFLALDMSYARHKIWKTVSPRGTELHTREPNGEVIDDKKAEKLWRQQTRNLTPATKVYLLTGEIMPFYRIIGLAAGNNIVEATTDNGQRLIGRKLSLRDLDELLRQFRVEPANYPSGHAVPLEAAAA